jgi:polysaccharide export outer membrane protein
MRIKCTIIILFIFINALLALAQEQSIKENQTIFSNEVYDGEFTYIIGPGDTLEINVWRHPDLRTQAKVRPDGKISFPLIEEIYVCNLTPSVLKKEIVQRISRIIRDPEVTINVIGFESKKYFVLGEVYRPGVYPFEGRVRVLEAISRAAGYKEDTAALKSVIIIKKGYTPNPKAIRVNLWSVINKADISQDVFLEPGDIIFVPKTFIANLNKFIDQFFTKTDPVLQYYLDIYNIREPGVLAR